MKGYITSAVIAAAAICGIIAASRTTATDGTFIPAPPDYTDTTMWITSLQDSCGEGADIFYLVSTWEKDWYSTDSLLCHHADVWNPRHRQRMASEINRIAGYMGPGNNFYAPYYRHTTIEAFVTQDEDTVTQRMELPLADIRQAFDEFQHRRDRSRPFVVAGFSQGALAVVDLLKYMDEDAYSHLVAAYVMGWKVTPQDTLQSRHIRPAQGDSDTGVTICYNTVKAPRYAKPIIAGSCFAINPVNWRTDTTSAILHDTISVSLCQDPLVLVVKGYSGSEYKPYKNLVNVGDIHSCEPWLYSECLARNIATRTKAWRAHRHPGTAQKIHKKN